MVSFTLFANMLSEPSSRPTLRPDKCLRRRLNTNQCSRCVTQCPSGALSEHNREIDLDETQCTGCMLCVAKCPQDALMSEFDPNGLLHPSQTGENVVLSCARQQQEHPEEVTIPCVGIFSKQTLTAFLFAGYRSIVFNMVGCAECCNRKASHSFIADAKQLIGVFSDLTPTKFLLIHKKEQPDKPVADRRSFLTKIRKITTDVTKKCFAIDGTAQTDRTKAHRQLPFKTQLIKNLTMNVDKKASGKIAFLFGYNLSANQECNLCPLCKGICPTGAIKRERSEQGKKLTFEMWNCTGCGLCVEFCKTSALSLRRLMPGDVQTYDQCQTVRKITHQ